MEGMENAQSENAFTSNNVQTPINQNPINNAPKPIQGTSMKSLFKQYILISSMSLLGYELLSILVFLFTNSQEAISKVIIALISLALSLLPSYAIYSPIFYVFAFLLLINARICLKLRKSLWLLYLIIWFVMGILFSLNHFITISKTCTSFGCVTSSWTMSILVGYLAVTSGLAWVLLRRAGISKRIGVFVIIIVFILGFAQVTFLKRFDVNTIEASSNREAIKYKQERLSSFKQTVSLTGGYYFKPQYLPKNIDKEARMDDGSISTNGSISTDSMIGNERISSHWYCKEKNQFTGKELIITQYTNGYTINSETGAHTGTYEENEYYLTKDVSNERVQHHTAYEKLGATIGIRSFYIQIYNRPHLIFEINDPSNVKTQKRFFEIGADSQCFEDDPKTELIKIARSLKKTQL